MLITIGPKIICRLFAQASEFLFPEVYFSDIIWNIFGKDASRRIEWPGHFQMETK
jgi:hypothetical protein